MWIRTNTCLAVIVFSGCVTAAKTKEPQGPSIQGDGCRVKLFDGNGSLICAGISVALPMCTPWTRSSGGVGGARIERVFLGTQCPPPHVGFANLSPGVFAVEASGAILAVICDDADTCQRFAFKAEIEECCQRNPEIKDTASCRVMPPAGACGKTTNSPVP